MQNKRHTSEVVITRWKKNQDANVYYKSRKLNGPSNSDTRLTTKTGTSPVSDMTFSIQSKPIPNDVHTPYPVHHAPLTTESLSDLAINQRMFPGRYYQELPKADREFWVSDPPPQQNGECSRWCIAMAVILSILITIVIIFVTLMIIVFGFQVFTDTETPEIESFTSPQVILTGVSKLNKSVITLYNTLLNATEAEKHCANEESHLATFKNEFEELNIFDLIKKNYSLMENCDHVFLGYRSIQTKEWVSQDSHYGFHAHFTTIWNKWSYDSAKERCSHSAKALDYKISPTPCNFSNDCIMCQTKDCGQSSGYCFKLKQYKTSNYEEGVEYCKNVFNGILAPVTNEKVHQEFLAVIEKEDVKKQCTTIAVGMVLNRRLELLDETEVDYIPKSFNASAGSIQDNCVAISLHTRIDTMKFVDCREKNCFVCK